MNGRAEAVVLDKWLASGFRRIGQIAIELGANGVFALTHRDDLSRDDLVTYLQPDDATAIARFDDQGNYRPLKTAPNLKHGWRLIVPDQKSLAIALDLFYPGRLSALAAYENDSLVLTPLRETLNRQTGMYRSAAKITDEEADRLVGMSCRSDTRCLRTVLWPRDRAGTVASSHLPLIKFDPTHDQTGLGEPTIPLLCQEACNLIVAEARKITQGRDTPADS